MAKSFLGEAIQPPVPFNSPLPSIKPLRSILQNGGVIFPQLSCHILENVNERVCKIKFMGCQWRIRTRRAITYLLSSWSLWYVKQKSMQLNAGISIVPHFTMNAGPCALFPSPRFSFHRCLPLPHLFLFGAVVKLNYLSPITSPKEAIEVWKGALHFFCHLLVCCLDIFFFACILHLSFAGIYAFTPVLPQVEFVLVYASQCTRLYETLIQHLYCEPKHLWVGIQLIALMSASLMLFLSCNSSHWHPTQNQEWLRG